MGEKIGQHGFEQPEEPQPTRQAKRVEAKQSAAAGNPEVYARPVTVWSRLQNVVTRSTPAFEVPATELPKDASIKHKLIAAITRSTPAFRGQQGRRSR